MVRRNSSKAGSSPGRTGASGLQDRESLRFCFTASLPVGLVAKSIRHDDFAASKANFGIARHSGEIPGGGSGRELSEGLIQLTVNWPRGR